MAAKPKGMTDSLAMAITTGTLAAVGTLLVLTGTGTAAIIGGVMAGAGMGGVALKASEMVGALSQPKLAEPDKNPQKPNLFSILTHPKTLFYGAAIGAAVGAFFVSLPFQVLLGSASGIMLAYGAGQSIADAIRHPDHLNPKNHEPAKSQARAPAKAQQISHSEAHQLESRLRRQGAPESFVKKLQGLKDQGTSLDRAR